MSSNIFIVYFFYDFDEFFRMYIRIYEYEQCVSPEPIRGKLKKKKNLWKTSESKKTTSHRTRVSFAPILSQSKITTTINIPDVFSSCFRRKNLRFFFHPWTMLFTAVYNRTKSRFFFLQNPSLVCYLYRFTNEFRVNTVFRFVRRFGHCYECR